MTRDEAIRDVVEAVRLVVPRGAYSLVWSALDRLDAIPEEPGLPAICEHCGEVKAWNGEAWVGHCHEAPAPEQKTVRALAADADHDECMGWGVLRNDKLGIWEPCRCVRAIDIRVGEVSHG